MLILLEGRSGTPVYVEQVNVLGLGLDEDGQPCIVLDTSGPYDIIELKGDIHEIARKLGAR